MAFVVSATQPPGGSLGDEWFNPTNNELKKLVALNGTTVTYVTVNVGNTANYFTTPNNNPKVVTTYVTSYSNVTQGGGQSGSYAPVFISASGGNMVTSGNYTYHTFNTSSTFALTLGIGYGNLVYNSAQVLMIGGGGGGGGGTGGGGGAGGFYETTISNLISGTYTIIVGAGGTGGSGTVAAYGGDGTSSSANITPAGSFIALYGGGGGSYGPPSYQGRQGASSGAAGGGGTGNTPYGAVSSLNPAQGYPSGANRAQDGAGAGGGGGGAGGNLNTDAGPSQGGYGGQAKITSIRGYNEYFAGGGGGGIGSPAPATPGSTGSDSQNPVGGGRGGNINARGSSAFANFGGGGGGGGANGNTPTPAINIGGNGGSGTVIIRYQTS
jgi:hypothetical protein